MEEPKKVEITPQELQQLLKRLQGTIPFADYEILSSIIRVFLEVVQALEEKKASIANLRAMLFGSKTEKTRTEAKGSQGGQTTGRKKKKQKKKRKGHGRNGVDEYPDAKRIHVAHETLKAGECCPDCPGGKLHSLPAALELRIKGQPLLDAVLYLLERLRCASCGQIYLAKLPEEAGTKKYDEAAGAIIALLKYGMGLPFYRLEKLQDALHVPLPSSVQWEIVAEMAEKLVPVLQELSRQAAQAKVVHNDDTGGKILQAGPPASVERKDAKPPASGAEDKERKGTYTSAIVATDEGQQIAMYFTGHKYAGENLEDVLRQRVEGLPPPIQMCDALLSRNLPGKLKTIVANCIAHARRKFFVAEPHFPEECRYVLEELALVYGFDDVARGKGLTANERLELHKEKSGPIMERLETWLKAQRDEKKVEPNSGLGQAIKYFLNHWEAMTLFLREAGAPLDNNLCERCLKLAILHRKNAYFYKTERGAAVGDLFMSLIQTARLNDVNPLEYLIALQKNLGAVRERPGEWMPWRFKKTLTQAAAPG